MSDDNTSAGMKNVMTESLETAGNVKMGMAKEPRRAELLWCYGLVLLPLIAATIIITGYLHWGIETCIVNYGEGFVDEDYYSPCEQPYLKTGRFVEDKGRDWYFWQETDHPWYASVINWTLFFIHLLSNWYILYKVQVTKLREHGVNGSKNKRLTYSNELKWYNYYLFGINTFAYFIHLIVTHTIYDGLASDTFIASSQASVTFLVFVVFIMRYPERGLVFMVKSPKVGTIRKCCSRFTYVNVMLS